VDKSSTGGSAEAQISDIIKRKFDMKYSPTWHCIVGKNFTSSVSYENKTYFFFYLGQLAILLYKLN
jgi:dynein light chain LC8-type